MINDRLASSTPAKPCRLFAITDACKAHGYLVTNEAVAVGWRVGPYLDLCGGEVLAASSTSPEHGCWWSCIRWAAR